VARIRGLSLDELIEENQLIDLAIINEFIRYKEQRENVRQAIEHS
jgi:hypothetical protein